MGGGSSRYEETDWTTATGKVLSAEETVDGSPPTSKHGLYTVIKQGINQRDFDVIDEECNLVYTTQCIEGTLAWFDVLGKGMGNYLLRVQVDLSRRYWIIYRYGQPAYSGQFPDMYATMKLRDLRGESAPCLYKQACITVSWSRYYAIVNRYGPPPIVKEDAGHSNILIGSSSSQSLTGIEYGKIKAFQAEMERTSIGTSSIDNATQPFMQQSMNIQCDNDSEDKQESNSGFRNEHFTEQENSFKGLEISPVAQEGETLREHDYSLPASNEALFSPETKDDKQYQKNRSYHLVSFEEKSETENSLTEAALQSHILVMKQWKEWAKKSAGMDQPAPNPLEGYLMLHDPILKCEEVNSFMGQHQTMLISSEEAKQLEAADLAAARKETPPTDRATQTTVSIDSQKQGKRVLSPKAQAEISSFPRMKQFSNWIRTKSIKVLEAQIAVTPNTHSSSSAAANVYGKGVIRNNDHPEILRKSLNDDNKGLADDSGDEKKVSMNHQFGVNVESPSPNEILSVVDEPTSEMNLVESNVLSSELCGEFPTPSTVYEPGVEESKGGNAVLLNDEVSPACDNSTNYLQSSSSSAALKDSPLEPLVGYWIWDNTMQVHKMKMTVAKDSDLALHVVLAVVTNQLRLERNMLLTTV